MKRAALAVATLFAAAAIPAGAAETAAPSLAASLAGHTLNAVVFVPRLPGSRGGELSRLMLQAYLRADGRALVRTWDTNRNAYTPPAERRWGLSGTTLCLEVPVAPSRPICADVHVWGPRIAGVNGHPYAMLDGDLQPGNAITGVR